MEGLDFAGELRRLMDESGISLRKLASRIPVDPGHLSRVANGKRPPGVELAKRCDEILGSGRTLRQAAETATHAASGQSAVGGVADPLTVCVPVMRNGRAQLMALDRRTLLKGAAAGAAAMATGAAAWTTRSQHLAPEAADHLIDRW